MQGSNQEIIIQGTPGSPGIAFAPVHVAARGFESPEVYEISADKIAAEKERFQQALDQTKTQIDELRNHIEKIAGNGEGQIFEAHLMVLEDSTLLSKVSNAITERQHNAEYAFYAVMQTYLEAMRRINDSYLKERAIDIEDVCQRVLKNFKQDAEHQDHLRPDHHHIIVSYDLTPSDTASIDRNHVLGFATEQGSVNSHTVILARSLGIPAIVGLETGVIDIKALSESILDGYTGKLILNPSAETTAHYRQRAKHKEQANKSLQSLREEKTMTLDGREITLSANMEFTYELPMISDSGAKGIGLFRTEFYLLEGGEMPNEHEQEQVYSEVIQAVQPHETIIRTLDAGGDKIVSEPLSQPEPNPFLGWRGIRVSLTRKSIFKEQLRAILRSSIHGKVGILFPMISGLREVLEAKEIVKRCMDELSAQNIPFDPDIQIGVMIEVPSAAIMAHEIAREVDFFSIGTNDLVQYTVAVDRVNPYVAHLYKPTHPAVMRLIDTTVRAAKDHGIWTGVCGEMASDLNITPLLVGLGIDELSVGAHKLPSVKKAIRSLSLSSCTEMAQEALKARTTVEIAELTTAMAKSSYADLLD